MNLPAGVGLCRCGTVTEPLYSTIGLGRCSRCGVILRSPLPSDETKSGQPREKVVAAEMRQIPDNDS